MSAVACPDCATARTVRTHTYRMGCLSCRLRHIADSPAYAASELARMIRNDYRALLELAKHPQGWMAAHREAVAWRRVMDDLPWLPNPAADAAQRTPA